MSATAAAVRPASGPASGLSNRRIAKGLLLFAFAVAVAAAFLHGKPWESPPDERLADTLFTLLAAAAFALWPLLGLASLQQGRRWLLPVFSGAYLLQCIVFNGGVGGLNAGFGAVPMIVAAVLHEMEFYAPARGTAA